MEKTLTIDGKEVRFKSTAATPLRFKSQFRKDFFAEISKLNKLKNVKFQGEDGEPDYDAFALIDFELFYNIIWSLAKTGNPQIPEPITWLDTFEEFPIGEIMPELQDLIAHSIQGKKGKKIK
ncbi:hypothetical protein [Metabacillus halosaccharovorans]|uniref:hypothetical protein n=1 Tax=Metabacillus halosaccharovorans TaxID=930124 RepID=UPI00203DFCB4|nr:hypothetical protein [Metabacillus halosaccharovorans]MCM3444382.1 hypothetical protein [Metabacillus halosaccharovorans]